MPVSLERQKISKILRGIAIQSGVGKLSRNVAGRESIPLSPVGSKTSRILFSVARGANRQSAWYRRQTEQPYTFGLGDIQSDWLRTLPFWRNRTRNQQVFTTGAQQRASDISLIAQGAGRGSDDQQSVNRPSDLPFKRSLQFFQFSQYRRSLGVAPVGKFGTAQWMGPPSAATLCSDPSEKCRPPC
jgi:hypothetical protein